MPVVSVVAEHTLKFASKAQLLTEIISVSRLFGRTGVRGVKQLHSLRFESQILLNRASGFKHTEQLSRSFSRRHCSSGTCGAFPFSQNSLHEVRLSSL